jgi:hypothetical protein
LDGGKQKPHQNANNGDHHQQFHKGETLAITWTQLHQKPPKMTAEKKLRIKQSPRQGRQTTLASKTHEKPKKDHTMKPFGRIGN